MDTRPEAAEWLIRAKGSLGIARIGKINPEILYEDLCFHCQQAAEKAFKALLKLNNIEFRKEHSLENLIIKLEINNIIIPEKIKAAAISQYPYGGLTLPLKIPMRIGSTLSLSENAVDTRYPGEYQPLDEKGYRNALEKAEIIVLWVEQQI
jgi:HEPN domain-containing protein